MTIAKTLSAVTLLCLIIALSQPAFGEIGVVKADYDYVGRKSPANWHRLKPEYAICGNGKFQSPVNFYVSQTNARPESAIINWNNFASSVELLNTGKSVDFTFKGNSSGTVSFANVHYKMANIHYHLPSEHLLDERHHEGEIHFVHKSDDNRLLVVGFFLDVHPNAAPNPFVEQFVPRLPMKPGQKQVIERLQFNHFSSCDLSQYFTYKGSLTTPPCSENVRWIVMRQPIVINPHQYEILKNSVPYNARPVQVNEVLSTYSFFAAYFTCYLLCFI
ncbi:alpha carbonic anhydrase [Paraphysoderma sedebokerense]|nr:alpha carbonic anhydrase [Paraphysoderma sedebokerense]